MLVVLLVVMTGCTGGHDTPGRWSVRSVSLDGRVLHLGVDVSCNATIRKSHVHEYQDRVLIEIDTHAPGGSCKASLTVRDLRVQLRAPLGARWVDGACVGGCTEVPDRAALRCTLDGPPFAVGYLPSGWRKALGTAIAYQSATGDATVEFSHGDSSHPARPGTEEVSVLGNQVTLDTISGGFAVAVELGAGPACGHWVLSSHGVPRDVFTTIAQQLFPR
jgi:hypothetical protein